MNVSVVTGEKANALACIIVIVARLQKFQKYYKNSFSDINKFEFKRIITFQTLQKGVWILAFSSIDFLNLSISRGKEKSHKSFLETIISFETIRQRTWNTLKIALCTQKTEKMCS